MDRAPLASGAVPLLLALVLLVSGCGISASYRSADKKTIRDYHTSNAYRKRIGVLVLTNTTTFTSDRISAPFMETLLAGLKSEVPKAQILLPGDTENTPFLWEPPRIANGDIDVFGFSAQARQAGLNAVMSPILMDIRVSKEDSGFWFLRDLSYILQIQTAAAVYDTITGARLSLGILTDTIDITKKQYEMVKQGQEVAVDGLVEIAKEMGTQLGEQMGAAIKASPWVTSVVGLDGDRCVLPAGGAVGIEAGDRFSVLDAGSVLTGLNDQRYIVPGSKIGEMTITQATERQSLGQATAGSPPPVGSIVVPDID